MIGCFQNTCRIRWLKRTAPLCVFILSFLISPASVTFPLMAHLANCVFLIHIKMDIPSSFHKHTVVNQIRYTIIFKKIVYLFKYDSISYRWVVDFDWDKFCFLLSDMSLWRSIKVACLMCMQVLVQALLCCYFYGQLKFRASMRFVSVLLHTYLY